MKFSPKHMLVAAALAVLPTGALAAGFGPLIDAQDLNAATQGEAAPLILDIRPGKVKDSETTIYAAGHIPGALAAPYNLFRGPKENPGKLVSEAKLTEVLQGLGVTADSRIVIVHQGKNETDFGSAARVYWTLKSTGVSQLAILNGGVNAWTKAGLPLEKGPAAPVAPSSFTASFDPTWTATTDDVKAIVDGAAPGELIDARTEAFWEGNAKHGAALRPGTLPQSRYFTHARWFDADTPALIDATKVAALAAEGGFEQGDNLVSFCNTGHWAATNWFALSELAGIEGVKLYPDSMVGWTLAGHEMDNVPGPLRNLYNRITGRY